MVVMAAVIHEKGEPDVFVWEPVELEQPGPGEVRIRHSAIGVNYVDTYHRRGMDHPWPVPPLPCVIGLEGVGVIEQTGPKVDGFAAGDKVAYAAPPLGAYAQKRNMPVAHLLKLPDNIPDEQAAGMILKGLTAQYLLHRTYQVKPGDCILVHAAAGGMGLILCQWASHLGACVIGTVSSREKAEQAKAAGCDHPVVHTQDDFHEVVMEVTGGEGVPVVYESIGKDTFDKSLDCLRPLGILASFGHASGPPPKVDVIELGRRGSLFVTRPAIMHYMDKRDDLDASARDLFDVVASGAVKIQVNHRYPLKHAAKAHRAIEQRQTTGSTILLPYADE